MRRLSSNVRLIPVPLRLRLDQGVIVTTPRLVVRRRKRFRILDPDGDFPSPTGTNAVLQAGVARAAASQNEHHAPVKRTEDAREGRLVDVARLRTTARMRMNPDPRKTLRRQPSVNLFVKEVGDRPIVELHGHGRAGLSDKPYIFDQQRISGGRDSEAADFGGAEVAPVQ